MAYLSLLADSERFLVVFKLSRMADPFDAIASNDVIAATAEAEASATEVQRGRPARLAEDGAALEAAAGVATAGSVDELVGVTSSSSAHESVAEMLWADEEAAMMLLLLSFRLSSLLLLSLLRSRTGSGNGGHDPLSWTRVQR